MRILVLLFALATISACATPVSAQAQAPDAVAACLADAEPDTRNACMGVVAGPCMDEPVGVTTVGMIQCLTREGAMWEAQNITLIARLRATESSSQVAQLNAMLAAREPWVQARCAYSASIYEGGSLARVTAAACARNAAAELTIDLLERGDEG